jgi:hypothetical protein
MLRTVRISVLAVAAVLAPALTCAQQAQTATGLKAANRIIIDGVTSPSATPIRVDDIVFTEANNSAQVIGKGNTLVFTPNSNFVAQMNAYVLKSGGSKVASYTGMTARVGCFSVFPVDSNLMTLYEVNWSGSSVWVYARSYDVYITRQEHPGDTNVDDKHRWLVKGGQTARISDVHLCEPLVGIWPVDNLNTAIALGATSAVVVTIPLWPPKQDMSAVHP